jgi:hypothetical protein
VTEVRDVSGEKRVPVAAFVDEELKHVLLGIRERRLLEFQSPKLSQDLRDEAGAIAAEYTKRLQALGWVEPYDRPENAEFVATHGRVGLGGDLHELHKTAVEAAAGKTGEVAAFKTDAVVERVHVVRDLVEVPVEVERMVPPGAAPVVDELRAI